MEYITIKQASDKWGVSERYVRRVCTEGRIAGVTKIGNAWALPRDAEKPIESVITEETAKKSDAEPISFKTVKAVKKSEAELVKTAKAVKKLEAEPVKTARAVKKSEAESAKTAKTAKAARKTNEEPRASFKTAPAVSFINPDTSAPPARVIMPLLNTSYTLGAAMESVNAIEDADTRAIALGEYYYFSGQSAKASDTVEEYLTNKDLALRLSACLLYSYANLALDRIARARQALSQIRETAQNLSADAAPIYRAYTVFVTACANVLLHLPMPESPETMRKYVHMLPAGLKMFALYAEAHQAYLQGSYGAAIGISETALAIEGEIYPIPAIYLHLAAAMGYINLKHLDEAREHLLEAWEIAKPDEMIEAFGEHHGLLGGMIEAVFKKDYAEDFRRIINITYSFSAGWRKIHNPDTGHYVADDLTTTEFTIAMLAARGWTNKEIGAHIDISSNTVKMHISTALQKLGITQRKDLAQFMLK